MSKLKSIIGDGNDQRMIELFNILDDERTGNIDDVYHDMLLARKIILNPYNTFTVSSVQIRGVDFYNNNSERNREVTVVDEKLKLLLNIAIEKLALFDILMPFRFINATMSPFYQAFWIYIKEVHNS